MISYPDVDYFDKSDLIASMQDIYQSVKIPFVLIIDEWDCIFREYKHDTDSQRLYLDFIRNLLKDQPAFSGNIRTISKPRKNIWIFCGIF